MNLNEQRLQTLPENIPFAGKLFIRLLSKLSQGSLKLIDPHGNCLMLGQADQTPHAELKIHDWKACGLIMRQGDVGFAESLRQGWVESSDLVALFTLAIRNQQVSAAVNGHWWALLLKRLKHLVLNDNSRRGSRKNILAHYDLGNDFYRLWLDASMTYSAAIFDGQAQRSLYEAQIAKYDRIIDQLDARLGQTVLEIGCGWGGFAERAAQRGLNVVGITLSDAQLEWAQNRIANAGLSQQVELKLQDYRDVQGQFDHIVSIEMFEAVGLRHWPEYFSTLARCLKPGGRIVVQTIDINDQHFDSYRHGTDFIQQYIFPGGMLPSPARFTLECQRAGLQIKDATSIGIDYADTMKCWSQKFEEQINAIRTLGFDDPFIRIWRMYLAYCEVGFREGRTDVKQWTLCAKY